ncbi:MAG: Threonine synthase [Candidatus Accumulibacter regalis]|jgi:threonine synthase|uniref:Threonine synthase n=1 Tax=Accumulibacter regalis TaxID=522306 RepID=A0A011QJH2_ACCRE|nr:MULTISPECIES: threonine synthase [unclassified Candidatus Accumulibacter]EXI89195.1 MAG: Threonine synthase [Candidatus Accumulibacter regalis]MBL8368027.1 threonine synthase [Accumulibacter sp.]MBN8515512.1 threonine synthase [Accumulibacter sp.]MBO3701431.1 threonine synthase [Accumulibacter sp.]HRE71514.1 threonine synthase [Accumulibacter sp.]
MRYLSTRGQSNSDTKNSAAPRFTEILLAGLAPDGGLYLPESYPQVGKAELEEWRGLSYADLAYAVLSRFIDDIPAADLQALIARTYTAQVYGNGRNREQAAEITPLRWLEKPDEARGEGGLAILELSNGPTLAFKDMAMQLLGNLFEYVLAKRGEEINILGATSGDTGSSAEYAMRGKERLRVFMLSPHQRMSAFQRAQMYSLHDENIHNIAVRGSFDDAQDIVKAVSSDHAFKARYRIGAVNSINWARIAAQIVYYFKAYFAATGGVGGSSDREVAFAVPSGNFGNICAGHIARMMGLPIGRLVLATNENDVLKEFFQSGVYRPRVSAETHATSSPSMDISKASNFERFAFDLVGRNASVIRNLWSAVDAGGSVDLSKTSFFAKLSDFGFAAGRSTHADRLATIRQTFEKYGLVIDPHTADGLKVGSELRSPDMPMVVLETALPAKFEETIGEALGRRPERPAALQGIEDLPQRVEVIDVSVDAVKAIIQRLLD